MKGKIYIMVAVCIMTACQSNTITDEQRRQGRLVGQFSVSNDQKVYFSQGNLQYCPATKTYRFAEEQMTVIGHWNDSISRTYNGYIDLFGHGTGRYPASYGSIDGFYAHFIDWGENAISNGGNQGGIWRTLTQSEWNYLLYERDNATSLVGVGNVASQPVVMLFPDGWNRTDEPATLLTDSIPWLEVEKYTRLQLTALANEGVVFLPAAGYRSGKPTNEEDESCVYHLGEECAYWFAPDSVDESYCWAVVKSDALLELRTDLVIEESEHYLSHGLGVRLVQDVR